jgi:hypothetical protein
MTAHHGNHVVRAAEIAFAVHNARIFTYDEREHAEAVFGLKDVYTGRTDTEPCHTRALS